MEALRVSGCMLVKAGVSLGECGCGTSLRKLWNVILRHSPSWTRSTSGRGRLPGLSCTFPAPRGLSGFIGTTSPRRAYIMPSGRTVPNRLMTITWSSATTEALTVLEPGQDRCACTTTADNATTARRHVTPARDIKVLPEVSTWFLVSVYTQR